MYVLILSSSKQTPRHNSSYKIHKGEIPVKAKGRAGEGEPSGHDPSQNPMKQRGRKEY